MSKSKHVRRSSAKPNKAHVSVPTLAEVCASPDELLGKLDLAAVNLMCATGLPGAEKHGYEKYSDWLDNAAHRVDLEIRRHWYRFIASPKTYHGSPGFFCCSMMLQVLQEDCGVRYSPERAVDPTWQDTKQEPVFRDSRDLFIHGIIDGPGGTCGSLPVLYVAVGRRLGYPLKLVEARGHLFFRWDDPLGLKRGAPERFNVEGAGHGVSMFPDEHYRTWPEPWTEVERKANLYLRSLTPKEELASFLCTRAACLEDNGRIDEAMQAWRWACGLVPYDPRPRNTLNRMIRRLQANIFEMNAVVAQTKQLLIDQRSIQRRVLPTHGDSCRCRSCELTREVSRPTGAPGHFPQCGCRRCLEIRAATGQRMPGHPVGCGCGDCRNIDRNGKRHGAQ